MAALLLRGDRPFVGLKGSVWVAPVGIALHAVLVEVNAAVVQADITGALFIIAARFMGRPTYAPADRTARVVR